MYFPPSTDCLQFPLDIVCSLSTLVVRRLHMICIFVLSPWKMIFTFSSDQVSAGNGSAGWGSRGFSLLFSIHSVPCGKPQLSLNPYLNSLFIYLFIHSFIHFAYLYCFFSCCHLPWAWGTVLQEHRAFEGNVNCRQHWVPSVFSSESSISESWTGNRALRRQAQVQEYSLFPGPGCVEVGLSEEGGLWEGGEGKGTFRSRCSWLRKESRSNQSSAVLQTIHSFGERQTKHSLLVQCINVRGLP